jgi:hypothetical protein
MTKLKVLVLCFPYFTDFSIVFLYGFLYCRTKIIWKSDEISLLVVVI